MARTSAARSSCGLATDSPHPRAAGGAPLGRGAAPAARAMVSGQDCSGAGGQSRGGDAVETAPGARGRARLAAASLLAAPGLLDRRSHIWMILAVVSFAPR